MANQNVVSMKALLEAGVHFGHQSEASAIMHSRKCWKIRWMGMIITHFFRS